MSLHLNGRPFGLVYADGGAGRLHLDEGGYNAFKTLCIAISQALEKVAA